MADNPNFWREVIEEDPQRFHHSMVQLTMLAVQADEADQKELFDDAHAILNMLHEITLNRQLQASQN